MAAVLSAVGSFAKSVAGAPATQAITGIGFTPKALILWTSAGQTTDTWIANWRGAVGFMDGATEHCMSWAAGPDDGFTNSGVGNNAKAFHLSDSDQVNLCEATLVSFDAGGFTLSWTTNDANPYLIHWMALGGDGLTNAKVKLHQVKASTGNLAVTGVGFVPDLVLNCSYGRNGAAPTDLKMTTSTGHPTFGAFTATGQWANTFYDAEQRITTLTGRAQVTDACFYMATSTPATKHRATYVSMDADGFTLNWTDVSTQDYIMSLCLKGSADALLAVGTFNKATGAAPAAQSITGLAHEVTGVLLSSGMDVTTAAPGVNTACGWGLGAGAANVAASTLTAESGVSANNDDGVDSSTKLFIKANNYAQTVDAAATLTSLNGDGFTIGWNPNDAVATEIGYVAFGGVVSSPVAVRDYRRRRAA